MKNNSLFLLVAVLFAIVSCGAADLYAQKRVSQYRNGIYYSAQKQPVQEQPAQVYSENVTKIEVPALGSDESYEERLKKFDSPVYIVNVEYTDLYPWWSLNFAWNSRTWGWYHSWYSRPYWGGPVWYSYWYPGDYWYWGDYWWHYPYRHHFYPAYYPIHRPVYHPVHRPAVRPGRDVYYGKRDGTPSYRNNGRGYVVYGGSQPSSSAPGSIYRKPAQGKNSSTPAVNGSNNVKGQGNTSSGNHQYRRTTSDKNQQSGNTRSSSSSEYRRSSSSSSGSSGQYRSSGGNTGGSYRSSGSSGSSGSSYRRR